MKALVLLVLVLAAPLAGAADHLVVLKKKGFEPEALSVKAGDSVVFRNDDPIEHSVLSQSAAKAFDLDALSPGASRKVSFDKPGQVDVECSQHDGMHLTIQVAP